MPPDLSQFVNQPSGEGHAFDSVPSVRGDGVPDLSPFVSKPSSEGTPFPDLGPFVSAKNTIGGEFTSGIASGINSLQSAAFGLLQLTGREFKIDFAGKEFGLGNLEEFGRLGVERNQREAGETPVSVGSIDDIEDVETFFRWASGALGNAIPSLALSIGGGGVGGFLAKRGVEGMLRKTVLNNAAKRLVGRGMTGPQAGKAISNIYGTDTGQKMLLQAMRAAGTDEVKRKAFLTGAAKGAFTASSLPQIGSIDIELSEAGVDAGLTSVLGGLAGGALDALPATRLISKMFPGVNKTVSKNFVKDFAKGMGIQGILEGSTEGGQEVIALAALAYHDPSFDMLDPGNPMRVIDSLAMGALVGALTGGLGSVAGETNVRGREAKNKLKLAAPNLGTAFKWKPTPAPITPEGFEPADNTVVEEIRARVHTQVAAAVEPVMNTIRNQYNQASQALNDTFNGEADNDSASVFGAVRDAQRAFVAGNEEVLSRLRATVDNTVDTIAEGAKLAEDSKAYIAEKTAELVAGVKTFVDDNIRGQAQEESDKLVGIIQREFTTQEEEEFGAGSIEQPGFEEDAFGQSAVEGGEATLTFGKENTQDEQSLPWQTESRAIGFMERLRARFPDAGEDAFEVRAVEGGFIVVVQDEGRAEGIREAQDVQDTIASSMLSAKGNPDSTRHVKVPSLTGKGANTILDLKTLVYGAARFLTDANTPSESFNAITARMLERGLITNETFMLLKSAFDKQFPNGSRKFTLAEAAEIRGLTKEAANRKGQLSLLATPIGQTAANPDFVAGRQQDLRKGEVDPADITRESRLQVAGNVTTDQVLDADGRPVRIETPGAPVIGEGPVQTFEGGQRDFEEEGAFPSRTPPTSQAPRKTFNDSDPNAEFLAAESTRDLPTEDEIAARRTASAAEPALHGTQEELDVLKERAQELTDRLGSAIALDSMHPGELAQFIRDTDELAGLEAEIDGRQKNLPRTKQEREKRHARRRRKLNREEAADKARAAKRKADLKKAKAKQQSVENRKKARKRRERDQAKKSNAVNTNATAQVFLPGESSTMVKAIAEIVTRASKLLSGKVPIRVVNRRAIRQMIFESHPHMKIVLPLLSMQDGAIFWASSQDVAYIFLPETQDKGALLGVLLHELGHALHFDTWNALPDAQKEALWEAFKADVASGRTTGLALATINKRAAASPASLTKAEFDEWMADQFVAWMADRKQPRNALQQFLESVALKLDALWAWVSANKGRLSITPSRTYGEFVDEIARKVADQDVTLVKQNFKNEGAEPKGGFTRGIAGGVINPNLPMKTWNQIVQRIEKDYPLIVKRAAVFRNYVYNAYKVALAPSTGVMRDLGKKFPAAQQLVRIFNRDAHGEAKQSSNYHQRINLMKGSFITKFEALTKNMTEAAKASLVARMRKMDSTNAEPKTAQEKQLRKLLDEMHDYLRKAGLPMGKIENYFPRAYSQELLIASETEIINHLMAKHNLKREQARGFFNSLVSRDAADAAALTEMQEDPLFSMAPGFRNMRSRTLTDPFFEQFLDANLDSVLSNYVNAAVKRAEYNRFLGQASKAPTANLSKAIWNPRAKYEGILKNMKAQGASDTELKFAADYVDANLGQLGRDAVPEGLRKAMAGMIAFQNMRVLMFTVFASLPDIVGPAIRSGDMKGAFKTIAKNMKEIANTESELTQMARSWGIISTEASNHILTEYVDNHYMPPTLRKWNTAFFKYTGLEWFTNFTRKMALSVGIDYIQEQALIAGDPTAKEKARFRAVAALKELGLNKALVDTWVKGGKRTWGGIGYDANNKADQQVAEALVQFVDESIMRPNASQRPLLASHPAAMLVFHLKGFMYAMYDIVIKRMAHNIRVADNPAQLMAAVAPALAIMGLTAIGLELRELVTGQRRTDKMDGWEYTWELFERGGLTGISQLAIDLEGADERGQAELAAILGPTAGHIGDLLARPASQTIPKSIPIVSQLPWLRDAVRDVTPL